MRYSHRWRIDTDQMPPRHGMRQGVWESGFWAHVDTSKMRFREAAGYTFDGVFYTREERPKYRIYVALPRNAASPAREVVGRVCWLSVAPGPFGGTATLYIDTTRSRLTVETVVGLVVCAWGVFVFALHLRTWIQERRGA
jgi:hypothetical protein